MRKEVKLGMALGGGLVTLLIAYLIVAPPSDHKRGTQLVSGDGGGSIIDAPAAQPSNDGAVVTPVSDGAKVASADPAAKPEHVLPQQPTEQPKAGPKVEEKAMANRPAGRDPWERPLKDGQSPEAAASAVKTKPAEVGAGKPAGTHTPTVAEAPKVSEPAGPAAPKQAEKRKVASNGGARTEAVLMITNPNDAYGGGVNDVSAAVERAVAGSSNDGQAAPKAVVTAPVSNNNGSELGSTGATPTAGSTHVVRSGETFSSIAQAVYGSAAYYPHLIRANPHANPNNLKLGTAIVIPKVEDVKASGGGASAERSGGPVFKVAEKSAGDDVKIDPVKQYRVQSGDSLYKISLKKFGTPNYVEAIYEKNRQTIGANPTRLKLGMILEMPEKTAVTSSDPRSALGDGTAGGEQH